MYCAIDFETTGLLLPSAAPLEKQPYIVQVALMLLDDDFNAQQTECFLIKPPISIPAEVSKIHGITDAMVKDQKSFAEVTPWIVTQIVSRTWLGQNIPFDMGCLWHEMRRMNLAQSAMLDPASIDKADLMDLIIVKWGKRRKLGDVYQDLFGTKLVGAHDALADIKATVACYKALRMGLC